MCKVRFLRLPRSNISSAVAVVIERAIDCMCAKCGVLAVGRMGRLAVVIERAIDCMCAKCGILAVGRNIWDGETRCCD